jgi:hypothetical protein
MNRFYAALLLAFGTALPLGACGDDHSADSVSGAAGGGSYADCSQYRTCGTCTPVAGCGWCFNRTGGACATDPNECATVSEFTWTWDPEGCPDVDASVVPLDAGSKPLEGGAGG